MTVASAEPEPTTKTPRRRRRWTRRLLRGVVVAVAGVLIIGVSRLYLGVHWLTDVLTGWLLGGAWLAMCVTALLVYQLRRDAHRRGRGGEGPVVSVAPPTTALP